MKTNALLGSWPVLIAYAETPCIYHPEIPGPERLKAVNMQQKLLRPELSYGNNTLAAAAPITNWPMMAVQSLKPRKAAPLSSFSGITTVSPGSSRTLLKLLVNRILWPWLLTVVPSARMMNERPRSPSRVAPPASLIVAKGFARFEDKRVAVIHRANHVHCIRTEWNQQPVSIFQYQIWEGLQVIGIGLEFENNTSRRLQLTQLFHQPPLGFQ